MNHELIRLAFENSFKVLAISQDTQELLHTVYNVDLSKIKRVHWSFDPKEYLINSESDKSNIISLMPRKNLDHIRMVMDGLTSNLPHHWKIQLIEKMSNQQVKSTLKNSSIFLSFGSFEGLPAPPVEAAVSSNIVIGYHGNGGKEYWNSPNFIEIQPCDILSFIKTTLNVVHDLDHNIINTESLQPGILQLISSFSLDSEVTQLMQFAQEVLSSNSLCSSHQSTFFPSPLKFNKASDFIDRARTKLLSFSPSL